MPTLEPMIATAIRQVFAAGSGAEARERLHEVVERLEGPAPKVARLLEQADVLAFFALSARALDEAEKHQPARAGQP